MKTNPKVKLELDVAQVVKIDQSKLLIPIAGGATVYIVQGGQVTACYAQPIKTASPPKMTLALVVE